MSKTDGQLETLAELVRLDTLAALYWLLTYDCCQISRIEFAEIEVSVLHGIKEGNDALAALHKELNVESIEKLLEETAEAQAYQRVCFREIMVGLGS